MPVFLGVSLAYLFFENAVYKGLFPSYGAHGTDHSVRQFSAHLEK